MKTSLLCLSISLWLVMKSPFCVTLTEPRPYFTQGTTLLNLRYNGPPLTYSMMESSGGFLSFDSSFLHDWTPASWCWGSALITFCGTRGKRLHTDMFRVCVKHVTLCSGWSLVVSCLAWDYYVSFTWNEVTRSAFCPDLCQLKYPQSSANQPLYPASVSYHSLSLVCLERFFFVKRFSCWWMPITSQAQIVANPFLLTTS